MNFKKKKQFKWIISTFFIMVLGLIILKFFPMEIYGKDILFDASAHIVVAGFILYVFWFFIDQNKNWRVPYLVFSFVALGVISVQRILRGKHNDIGILLGFFILFIGIVVPRWKKFKKELDF